MDTFIIAPKGAGKKRAAKRLIAEFLQDKTAQYAGTITLRPHSDVIRILAAQKNLSAVVFEDIVNDDQLAYLQRIMKGYRAMHNRPVLSVYCVEGEPLASLRDASLADKASIADIKNDLK